MVGDDYLPTWKVPSLANYYNEFGFGMKGSFDAWLRAQDKVCDLHVHVIDLCSVILLHHSHLQVSFNGIS